MRRRTFPVAAILAAVALAIAAASSAAAANASVRITNFSFMPDSVTVNVGESVTWTNEDGGPSHSATSDTGTFDTGVFVSGSRTVTFRTAGTFTYHCAVHTFMRGSVTVAGPTPVPTPAPTAPPTAPPATPPPATQPPATPRPSPPPPSAVAVTESPSPTPSPSPIPTPTPSPSPTATPLAVQAPLTALTTQAPAVPPAPGSSRTGEGPQGLLLAGAGGAVAVVAWVGWRLVRRP